MHLDGDLAYAFSLPSVLSLQFALDKITPLLQAVPGQWRVLELASPPPSTVGQARGPVGSGEGTQLKSPRYTTR